MLQTRLKSTAQERYNRVDSLLKRFSLAHCARSLIKVLSGDEARRLMIASSLLTNPSILLIDDFDTGLDSHAALSLLAYLHSLKKTIVVVLHQPTTRMMTFVDDLYLLGANGRTLYMGPYERALSVFHVQCPMDISPADFFLQESANARPTNPVVRTMDCEAILQEQLMSIKTSSQYAAGLTYSASKSYPSNFFQQLYWLTWRSARARDKKILVHSLLQSFTIVLLYGLVDFGVERSFFAQTTVQNVAGLLVRLLITLTRVCSFLVLTSPPINHDVLQRESKQQRLYSIMTFYLSNCLLEIPVIILIVVVSLTITVLLTGLQHFFQLCAIFSIATLCSTALAGLITASVRDKEQRLLLWMPISQILSIVNGFYINTRSIPYVLKWIPYVSLYYHSFSLLLLSQWTDVKYIACATSHWNSTTTRCNNNGADVLFSFNVETNKNGSHWMMLFGLTALFHVLSCIVLKFQMRK